MVLQGRMIRPACARQSLAARASTGITRRSRRAACASAWTITDGAFGKPWVFRYKDLKSWWSQPHYNRIDGEEAEAPTAWVPESKPIWFTEIGCPATDKGAEPAERFLRSEIGRKHAALFFQRRTL